MKTVNMETDRLCSNESPSTCIIRSDWSYSDTIDRFNRIVGLKMLKSLLQPKHEYFSDKKGYIIDYMAYRHPEDKKMLLYPKIGGAYGERLNRANPARKHQLSRCHTSRRVKMVIDVAGAYHLEDFKVTFLTLTMPKQLSMWLGGQKNGSDMAWRLFKKMWAWYNDRLGPGLAASVNLHTWKTDNPLEPHYHFHLLIPNYKVEEIDIEDDIGNKSYYLKKQDWHIQRGGREVPVSEDMILEVKKAWYDILSKFANKHSIEWARMSGAALGAKDLDIKYGFTDIASDLGRCKLIHWFNYQGRYPLEDYAKYSNDNTECPNPPAFITEYENRARCYGWWKNLNRMIKEKIKPKQKLNPVNGRVMDYYGHWTIQQLFNQGPLGFLEVVKGVPVYHRLNGEELAWLLSVQKKKPAIDNLCYNYS